MSKENTNLRLLGSPVNLTYRSKKKDNKKHSCNRPRSALQNSCFTPETQESFKRPFSADAKERIPSTRSFLNSFSAELLQSYNNSPINVKVLPPTKDILDNPKYSHRHKKDLRENVSDYGSEDTFISLGTRIKAKAQLGPRSKPTNIKNNLKYKNITRSGQKPMYNTHEDKNKSDYGLEIKITKHLSESPIQTESSNFHSLNSCKSRSLESYFFPLEDDQVRSSNSLDRKSRLEAPNIKTDVEKAIDTYSQRLNVTKQQLSLVEEESTQDIESVPSQNFSSLSPENSINEDKEKNIINKTERKPNHYIEDLQDDNFLKTSTFLSEPRTYNSFYDDFESNNLKKYNNEMSSTLVHTDASSKDSGYIDSGANEEKLLQHNYPLRFPSNVLKKSNSHTTIEDQPKSFDSASTGSNNKYYHKTFPSDKKYTEPLNHSRLLYKDFFIKKEGHLALPPQNSPTKSLHDNIPGVSESHNTKKDLGYPPYLINSPTKAYTSKVIEDYKKELEAINNLHELTLKDLKMDAISPTPLNIDKMFEQNSGTYPQENDTDNKALQKTNFDPVAECASDSIDNHKRDASKISTKELIQNYFKVKEADYNTYKNVKKIDKKYNNNFRNGNYRISDGTPSKQHWNHKSSKNNISQSPISGNMNNRDHKNLYPPLSARIEVVQNDKDVDSWMSLSAPTPRMINVEEVDSPHEAINSDAKESMELKCENESIPRLALSSSVVRDVKETPKDLTCQSTVCDIYSMLEEIESYGDNPVTSVASATDTDANKTESKKREEEDNNGPKDNFTEIFEFLEKVEQSANDALSVVTNTTPQTIPKLECLLKLPQTELAQRLVTASLQLEERSCCIALLQESLTNHKEQMISKVSNLEKQSLRNIAKVKQECEETIKRHQNFIDQLINDKKTLNHRIEQLVDERRVLEERWKRSAQALEERYKLELRNQHDKMVASQQELTVKGLEGELREMAERQQKEVSDLKMFHAEQCGRMQGEHANDLERLRRTLEEEKENALAKERQLASSRLEKQILELELTYQEQRTRLVGDMRAENERAAAALAAADLTQRQELEKWKEEQEKLLDERRLQMEDDIAKEREKQTELLKQKEQELEERFEEFKKDFQTEQQMALKKKVSEISTQHKQERDREIEKAIESMEAEAQAGRKELQEALRRNKEQYESELKELAETEAATLRRCRDAQARLRAAEDRCAELEVNVNQLETRNKVLLDKNSQLESQAEEIRASCEEAWKKKAEEMRQEMDNMKRMHEEQMHQLYAKVKVAVARKDSAIQALTRDSAKHQEKIALLEQKLQQQRKDFLKHK